MMIRTANGSLMKVTESEGQRMIEEHPYDYSHELYACEICEKESWTVQKIGIRNVEIQPVNEYIPIRMCYSCYIKRGGCDEGWNKALNLLEINVKPQSKKEKSNG